MRLTPHRRKNIHPSSCLTLKIPLREGNQGCVTDGETEAQGEEKTCLGCTESKWQSLLAHWLPSQPPSEAGPAPARPGKARTSGTPGSNKWLLTFLKSPEGS